MMGKSSSGKDTIFNQLLEDESLNLIKLVGYTTRPKREKEEDGKEYFFVTEEDMLKLAQEGKVIEQRVYDTVYGKWYYFTVDDGQIRTEGKTGACAPPATDGKYLYIGTLESFMKMREYYGSEYVIPIYIEVEDGVRLERAISREKEQEKPKYAEMCRRFLADEKDFSEENLARCGIKKRYSNNGTLGECLEKIRNDLQS